MYLHHYTKFVEIDIFEQAKENIQNIKQRYEKFDQDKPTAFEEFTPKKSFFV